MMTFPLRDRKVFASPLLPRKSEPKIDQLMVNQTEFKEVERSRTFEVVYVVNLKALDIVQRIAEIRRHGRAGHGSKARGRFARVVFE